MGLSGRAAVTGVGDTDYTRDAGGRSALALALEASLAAVRDAGLSPRDVDGVVMPIAGGAALAEDFVANLGIPDLRLSAAMPLGGVGAVAGLQCAAACGRVRHYPRPLCDACHSFAAEWAEARGDAAVHSWTVAHHPFHPAFRGGLPYVLVTADLPEGVRVLARLTGGAGAGALRAGLPLAIGVEEDEAGVPLPVVRPAAG